MKSVRKRLTYANVMSSIAVFLVVAGGTAFAASQLGKESVGTKQLKKEAVSLAKINKAAQAALKGATGPAGAKGADGPRGATGPQGAKGDTGPSTGPAGGALTGNYPNPSLAPNAITTASLADGAVTPSKLSEQYLPTTTPGVPVAGANVAANGTVRRYFNRFGGAPTVAHPATGLYTLTFPGLEGQAYYTNSIVLATLGGGNPGQISRASGAGDPQILTYNATGTAANAEFEMAIVLPGS
jgi:hypothetical protein